MDSGNNTGNDTGIVTDYSVVFMLCQPRNSSPESSSRFRRELFLFDDLVLLDAHTVGIVDAKNLLKAARVKGFLKSIFPVWLQSAVL